MKILFVQHLGFINGSGGTEKVCAFLANEFSDAGHTVAIATNENKQGSSFFPLKKDIEVINIYNRSIEQVLLRPVSNYNGKNPLLWLKHKYQKKKNKIHNRRLLKKMKGDDGLYIFNLTRRAKAWKSAIEQIAPDLIITMSIGSVLEITYQNNYNIPIVNSTNGRPDYDYTDILWYRSPAEMLVLKNSFKHLAATQVLFENYKQFVPNSFVGILEVIPNQVPQTIHSMRVNHLAEKSRYRIIQIGTLSTECKQQHLSIDLFAKIASKYPQWDLFFWGEGKDYLFLKKKIEADGLSNRIFLMGLTNQPMEELKISDIFLFPSKFEGFPLALTEAMSVGLPSLGFRSCSGVNELVKHNENGFLAGTVDEMQEQLELLMLDSELRQQFGKNAHESVAKFNSDIVVQKWCNLIEKVIDERKGFIESSHST